MKANNLIKILIIIALIGCNNQKNQINDNNVKQYPDTLNSKIEKEKNPWDIDKIVGKSIIFNNGDTLLTTLNDLNFLGQINYKNLPPYLLLTGLDCDNCDAQIAMYIHSPKDGNLIVKNGKNSFSLPGRLYNYFNDSLVYESQVYYGEILTDTIGVIWIQKTLQDDGSFKESSFLFHIQDSLICKGFLKDDNFKIKRRIEYQKNKGLCNEFEGQDGYTSP